MAALWCLSDDPCGVVCACMTHSLIVFGNFAMAYGVLLPWYGWTAPAALHYTIFSIICIMAMLSHLTAMTTNPGAVPLNCPLPAQAEESRISLPICHRCDGYKPPRAHHCSQCNRCILKMDHHCPWVNNCVGQNNQKHFILFLCYTLTLSTYALTMLAIRAVSTVASLEHGPTRNRPAAILRPLASSHHYAHGSAGGVDDAGPVFVNCLLFFESILFGLFTAAMLTDQLTSVLHDTTAIERLKKDHHAAGRDARADPDSCLYSLSETFGRPCSLLWLVPTSVRFNGLTYEQISSTELALPPYHAHGSTSTLSHRRRHSGDERAHESFHRRRGDDDSLEPSDSDCSDSAADPPLAPRYARAHAGEAREQLLGHAAEPDQLAPRLTARHGGAEM